MSRIGRKPIVLPKNVSLHADGDLVTVKGPKGSLSMRLSPYVQLKSDAEKLLVERSEDDRTSRAHHGLMRKLLANIVVGVSTGFERRLEIQGVGYKADIAQGKLQLSLGYSHPILFEIPSGIEISVEKQVKIVIRGADCEKVGQVAAVIRGFRSPDIYQGKGIRYEGEVIKVKPGKAGSK